MSAILRSHLKRLHDNNEYGLANEVLVKHVDDLEEEVEDFLSYLVAEEQRMMQDGTFC